MENKFTDIGCSVDYCAVTGATCFFLGIENAVVLINGPRFCFAQMSIHLRKYHQESLTDRLFTTMLSEEDMIFGGETKLKVQLEAIAKLPKVELLVIQNNCAASLIGDDLRGIVEQFHFKCPVVTMDCGGLQGCFEEGFCLAAERLLEELPLEAAVQQQGINLLGGSEQHYNFLNNYEEVLGLLDRADIKLQNCVSFKMSMQQLRQLRGAALNVVLEPELGLPIARLLEEKYGMPYIVPKLPIGLKGTRQWLLDIMTALGIQEQKEIIAYFDKEEQHFKRYCSKLRKINNDVFVDTIIVAGSQSLVMSLAEALRKEIVNYRNMELIIYNASENFTVKDRFYRLQPKLETENLKKARDLFLFGSCVEYTRLRHAGLDSGYFCISQPSQGEATFLPLWGIAGVKNLAQTLWKYYLNKMEKKF